MICMRAYLEVKSGVQIAEGSQSVSLESCPTPTRLCLLSPSINQAPLSHSLSHLPLYKSVHFLISIPFHSGSSSELRACFCFGPSLWCDDLNMSDGGKEDLAPHRKSAKIAHIVASRASAGPDEYGRAVSKVAIAQILQSTGFDGSRKSAVEALSDLTVKYILYLGKATHFYTNLSGRTSSNIFDLIQGLEDLSFNEPVSKPCFTNSAALAEIQRFVKNEDPVPLASSIPKFPIPKIPKRIPTFDQIGEEFKGQKHIPGWLPIYPPPHTYIHTPVWHERKGDPREDKIEQVRQRRKAEKSLLNLQKRVSSTSISGFRPVINGTNSTTDKGKRVVDQNPFLVPVLTHGKKPVSEIPVPVPVPIGSIKRRSVLDAFGPIIEAANCTDLDADSVPVKKQIVRFKLGVDEKPVGLPLGLEGRREKVVGLREDERDDKKRRAEMILKESMENPQELTQL
ncbi:hypothetical protein LUZ60_001564 [Juncus effusus]|nr:hypothetical protein LUZ60_001564 [Juncus effusus]